MDAPASFALPGTGSLDRLGRRRCLGLFSLSALPAWPVLAVLPGRAAAQADWRRVAVPAYSPPAFVDGLLAHHALPRALAFQQAARQLAEACAARAEAAPRPSTAEAPRQAWRDTLVAWAALVAVATGPLIERRSARRIDFHPTRPEQILRAIAKQPQGEADFERVGSAAKGLAALEWLLWAGAAPRDAAALAHAHEVALDLAREADAIAAGFESRRIAERSDEDAVAAMSEAVNQWIGGLEQLRMHMLLRPIEEARSRGHAQPAWVRPHSRADAAERGARWQALHDLSVFTGAAAPQPGAGLVPIETYLRGKGQNDLADRLRQAVDAAGAALATAGSGRPAAMHSAARAVAGVQALAEAEVAPALDIRVGFSDADGD